MAFFPTGPTGIDDIYNHKNIKPYEDEQKILHSKNVSPSFDGFGLASVAFHPDRGPVCIKTGSCAKVEIQPECIFLQRPSDGGEAGYRGHDGILCLAGF